MNSEQQQLLLMRGTIASLPEADQTLVKEIADSLREIVAKNKDFGIVALALVGAELSVQS